ncbi:hypothetical protein NFI96_005727 [Prochilodus magdalenae]|nr:hypothetical protein NFI96_005727 [Prochilodus magdalenae]
MFSEHIEKVQLVDRGSSRRAQVGTLYLTASHTIFVDNKAEVRNEIWVLHSLVCNVEKQSVTALGYPLLVRCKNFQVIQLIIPHENDCNDVFMSLLRLSRARRYEELYCFSFKPNIDQTERDKAWDFIDLRAEYSRMGLPNKLWHVSPINREYRVCDTYPTDLFVPRSATLPVIVGSSKFRSRGRFPTLSYYYKETQAAICRSSQPLSGFSARCLEDEQMLEAIMKSNPGSRFMYVVDTRPKLNAMANRATGKGYESEDNYTNIKFQFIGIENIHVMRNSQQKLIEVSDLRSPSMGEFLVGLENSDWLKHIQTILAAGKFIAKAVAEEGVSVLVHCSDGWDRTAQVCSVASVLLDPYYRTLKGFMVLVEKDWVSFGHKFSHRFWRGLYNHFDRGLHPRQSVLDCLIAVKEETQQLEELLAACELKLAALGKEQANGPCVKKHTINQSQALWAEPVHLSLASSPQDYAGGILGTGPKEWPFQQRETERTKLNLFGDAAKSSDPDNSDQESGVADFSCHSSSGGESLPSEDSVKDADSDEAAFSTA